MNFQTPVQQRFNSDQIAKIEANERFSVGLIYNFSFQKKSQQMNKM